MSMDQPPQQPLPKVTTMAPSAIGSIFDRKATVQHRAQVKESARQGTVRVPYGDQFDDDDESPLPPRKIPPRKPTTPTIDVPASLREAVQQAKAKLQPLDEDADTQDWGIAPPAGSKPRSMSLAAMAAGALSKMTSHLR